MARTKKKSTAKFLPCEGILSDESPFSYKEAYNAFRTNVIFSLVGANTDKKTIVLSSACPDDGKSTASANLAISLATLGKHVLLVDGDLRNPTAHVLFQMQNVAGLTNVISKQNTFEEVVCKDVRPNLDVLTCGALPPNPSELLASSAMSAFIEHAEALYDYVIIDTPPVLVVTDALTLSKVAAGIIIAVRVGTTTYPEISKTFSSLKMADFNLLGTVFIGTKGSLGMYNNYYYSDKNKK